MALDHYFDECERPWKMLGAAFTDYHRSLATSISGFRAPGFAMNRIVDPTAMPEQLADYPKLDDELRIPNFIVYVLSR